MKWLLIDDDMDDYNWHIMGYEVQGSMVFYICRRIGGKIDPFYGFGGHGPFQGDSFQAFDPKLVTHYIDMPAIEDPSEEALMLEALERHLPSTQAELEAFLELKKLKEKL